MRPPAQRVLVVALAAALLGACSGGEREPAGVGTAQGPERDDTTTGADATGEAATDNTDMPDATTEAAVPVAVVATGFEVPWGLVPLGDGSLLVGERDSARVFRVVPGDDPELVTTVPGVAPDGEGGLLGLAVPEDSPWHDGEADVLYAYATTEDDNRVLRLDPSADPPGIDVVLEGIPKASTHNGGRLAFGPDGHLYVTTGDASEGASSQDPDSLAGKILRLTTEGEPAPDNPDPASPVLSLGHRNVQGLDWDEQGRLWASEFGQNTLDEINLIEPGANYGWPEVEGPGGQSDFTDPVVSWPTADASPSGLAVGSDGALYAAALRGESLWRVPLEEGAATGEPERLLTGQLGRLRSVVTGPDGELWVLTSNTFRGDPTDEDDRLLRIADPAALDASTQVTPAG